jgi:hypothetical protein
MKGRPKVTRIQLDDHTDDEFVIFGLVSTEADYKLSQLLNKKLKITLRNVNTIDLKEVGRMKLSFSRYSDTSSSPEITFNLISNRSDKDYLLKKLKKIDYFFRINSFADRFNIEQLTSTLREIDRITAVFRLDPLEIKDKNLVYLTL